MKCLVDMAQPGKYLTLRNARIDMFKGSMRIAVDQWGRIEETTGKFTPKVWKKILQWISQCVCVIRRRTTCHRLNSKWCLSLMPDFVCFYISFHWVSMSTHQPCQCSFVGLNVRSTEQLGEEGFTAVAKVWSYALFFFCCCLQLIERGVVEQGLEINRI